MYRAPCSGCTISGFSQSEEQTVKDPRDKNDHSWKKKNIVRYGNKEKITRTYLKSGVNIGYHEFS